MCRGLHFDHLESREIDNATSVTGGQLQISSVEVPDILNPAVLMESGCAMTKSELDRCVREAHLHT